MHLVHLVNCLSFNFKNCKVENYWGGFINVLQEKGVSTSCEITNNLFSLNNLPTEVNQNIYAISPCNIIAIEGDNFIFDNNAFIEVPGVLSVAQNIDCSFLSSIRNTPKYIYTETVPITNCRFINTTLFIHATNVKNCIFQTCDCCILCHQNSQINNCKFEECTNIIFLSSNTKVTNCLFNSCFDNLINSKVDLWLFGGCDVAYCQFTNIKASKKSCIVFSDSNNHLHTCTFDGIEINSDNIFLIDSHYSNKQNNIISYIDNCTFKACSTKQQEKKLILETILVDSFLKKQSLCINKISNCHGLDNVQYIGKKSNSKTITYGFFGPMES